MAASYARLLGNPESVKSQLPPEQHAAFDMCWNVQEVAGGGAEAEKDRRVSLRTEEAVEKARAARHAASLIAAEEHAALYAAAEAEGGATFDLLGSMDLDNLEEAEPLIDGFLVKESIVRLYGPPKSYKSFVMLDMAGCVGAGIPWAGNASTASKVLYVVAEGVRGIKRRVRAWEAQNKRAMVGVHFYPKAVQLGERPDVSTLIRTAKRGGYEFIILDTQARCTVGMEENSASEMGVVVAALDVLKEVTGACVALVHHSGAAGGRARGSTAILGALDAEFEVEADKRNMSVTVKTRAQKDLAEARHVELDLVTPGANLALAVRARPQWYRPTAADLPPLGEREKSLLRAVAELTETGVTIAHVAKILNANGDDVRVSVNELMRKQCLLMKGNLLHLDRVGALYIQVGDEQLPEGH
jgi:hypothetical protein